MAVVSHHASLRSRLALVGTVLGTLFLCALWYKEVNLLPRETVEGAAVGSGKSEVEVHFPGTNLSAETPQSGNLPQDIALALVHYATATVAPQQSEEEIMVTQAVLNARAPCNFLVFGLGYDSLLWKSLNHGGRTVFLEETESWLDEMQAKHPGLEAYHMEYSTQLQWNQDLLHHSRVRRDKECSPQQDIATSDCRLAITNLPHDLYEVDWDVVMIDAPRGYFPEAPGRMGAIFTIAVLARQRKSAAGGNYTDIMLHDVDRHVENIFGNEFLCEENRVARVRRLWHFQVYPSTAKSFCPATEMRQRLYKRHS